MLTKVSNTEGGIRPPDVFNSVWFKIMLLSAVLLDKYTS